MKKIIILIGAFLIAIAIMAYLYFSKLGTENNAKDLALQSATNHAALVFSFQNDNRFYEIIESQSLIQQVLGKDKTNLLRQLKNVFISDHTLNEFIKDQQVYISILPDNKDLNFLFTIQIRQDKNLNRLYKRLKSKEIINKYLENTYSLKLSDSISIFLRIRNQVIIASTSLTLINDADLRLKENPFTDYIKEINLPNKNGLSHVYINFNQAPLLLKNIIAGNINGEIALFSQQNSFAALNYNFSKERILFNGITELKASNNYLKLFENISAQSTSIQNLLPDHTANYIIYAFNDYRSWLKKLQILQEQKKESTKANALKKNIKNQYSIDLNSVFPVFTKNQFVTFQLSSSEKLGAIALNNGEKVKQLLLELSTDYNEDIKIFKSPDILYYYFGEPFKKFKRPYYTIVDNNLIVANNASTVLFFLNNYRNNKLLIQTPQYLDAMNQLSSTSNISYYINTKNSTDLFRSNILLKYYKHLRADSGLKSFDTFYYQMSADKDRFSTNLLLNKYLKPEIPDSLSNH